MDLHSLAFSISNLGPKSFQKLINNLGDSKKAWEGTEKEFEKVGIAGLTFKKFSTFRKAFDLVKYSKELEKEKVTFISYLDKEYPQGFKKLENPPIGIFVIGEINVLKENSKVGVVGTRKITSYGKNVTESIVLGLVENEVCIVSGLALGVDGVAHNTAVSNGGKTISVLACGVDCCLPAENFSLYSKILKNGGLIISEYPLSQPPNKGTFLARNRLIAALSDGVLVTEAAEDSGSLVTADWGFKLDKKVFAVPGPINSQNSKGCLKLLKQGARLVTEAEDILGEFKIHNSKIKSGSRIFKNLSKEERKIIALLENEAMTIDEISIKTKIDVSKLFVFLTSIELMKIAKSMNGKWKLI